jgi:V/A-type H+-transporting ATPase subunit I
MSINLMASMLGEIPYVGPVLALLLLLGGHLFNFAISVLGAFIHSARLIFVEFFGRFYEGGGKPFLPLGMDSSWIKVRKPGKSAVPSNQ